MAACQQLPQAEKIRLARLCSEIDSSITAYARSTLMSSKKPLRDGLSMCAKKALSPDKDEGYMPPLPTAA
jgi:hypothetical protein